MRGEKRDRELLRRYHERGDLAAREELIEAHMSLVRSLARRYSYRGEQLEDLVQIGAIGLIKAIDRFDVNRGVELTTYATPNIIGEIKRHFRDRGWAVRVPRGLQELNVQLSRLLERVGVEEHAYEVSEDRAILAPGFRVLDDRERQILRLRFFDGLTQSQIAQQIGISQMHVSRLIRRSLEKIRSEIAAEGDEPTWRPAAGAKFR